MPKKRPHYKHTFPRLARSTLNELQQNQHEKASLVCVRLQSPTGLALVPCALSMVDVRGQLRSWITQRDKHPWYRKMIFILIFGTLRSYDPLGRGFFAWRQKMASVASLPRPCLIIIRKKLNACFYEEPRIRFFTRKKFKYEVTNRRGKKGPLLNQKNLA